MLIPRQTSVCSTSPCLIMPESHRDAMLSFKIITTFPNIVHLRMIGPLLLSLMSHSIHNELLLSLNSASQIFLFHFLCHMDNEPHFIWRSISWHGSCTDTNRARLRHIKIQLMYMNNFIDLSWSRSILFLNVPDCFDGTFCYSSFVGVICHDICFIILKYMLSCFWGWIQLSPIKIMTKHYQLKLQQFSVLCVNMWKITITGFHDSLAIYLAQ